MSRQPTGQNPNQNVRGRGRGSPLTPRMSGPNAGPRATPTRGWPGTRPQAPPQRPTAAGVHHRPPPPSANLGFPRPGASHRPQPRAAAEPRTDDTGFQRRFFNPKHYQDMDCLMTQPRPLPPDYGKEWLDPNTGKIDWNKIRRALGIDEEDEDEDQPQQHQQQPHQQQQQQQSVFRRQDPKSPPKPERKK